MTGVSKNGELSLLYSELDCSDIDESRVDETQGVHCTYTPAPAPPPAPVSLLFPSSSSLSSAASEGYSSAVGAKGLAGTPEGLHVVFLIA